jgi:DNA-binding NtrC family response regulator
MPLQRGDALDILLIVDPDPGRALALANVLRAPSRDVRVAGDLRAALEQIAAAQPDVLLVETALLVTGGAVLLERSAALAHCYGATSCTRSTTATRRRSTTWSSRRSRRRGGRGGGLPNPSCAR